MNVFYGHRKGEDGLAVQEAIEAAAGMLGPEAIVVSGVLDHERHYARCGSWNAWAYDVARGVDYSSRKPRYDVFLIPDMDVGKATRDIINHAIDAGKLVFYWRPGQKAFRVTGVAPNENESWIDGWSLVLDNRQEGG